MRSCIRFCCLRAGEYVACMRDWLPRAGWMVWRFEAYHWTSLFSYLFQMLIPYVSAIRVRLHAYQGVRLHERCTHLSFPNRPPLIILYPLSSDRTDAWPGWPDFTYLVARTMSYSGGIIGTRALHRKSTIVATWNICQPQPFMRV